MKLTAKKVRTFREEIYRYYDLYGRKLPWRETRDPYRILVSEVMLQQTQVSRVLLKYELFLKTFPTLKKLSRAKLQEVLKVWQGLGYNRRAKALHETAKLLVSKYQSSIPRARKELMSLPGIGDYSASAVRVFSFNKPDVLLETNIRSTYFHFFFQNKTKVSDKELREVVEATLDRENPKEWYFALMDYGAYLKKEKKGRNEKGAHYRKQSPFKGSTREIRGALVRLLTQEARSKSALLELPFEKEKIEAQLLALEKEGFLKKKRKVYALE
ncbi:MAG: A/G-specific adenine glycosylase [Candidatus Paceibacterota bacterium]